MRKCFFALGLMLLMFFSFSSYGQKKEKDEYFKDTRDGKYYKIVKISGEMWFAENINYSDVPACWCYENSDIECEKNGRLYTYDAAKKVCPQAWRLPTELEFMQLVDSAGSTGAEKITALGSDELNGFDLQFAGWRSNKGMHSGRGNEAGYWLDYSAKKKKVPLMFFDRSAQTVEIINVKKTEKYYSVRCIKD